MSWNRILGDLVSDVDGLRFGPPVTHVYNPLVYAGKAHRLYLSRYGNSPKEAIFVGMNPGPWGMAQNGIPFGEVSAVRGWLGIDAPIGRPANEHASRPVTGLQCRRSEVSGARLWGWVQATFGTPERFFDRFLVVNYCPLLFLEETGRNRTPDKLPLAERVPLLAACDRALRRTIELLRPRRVVGVGAFAEGRARAALAGLDVRIGRISHPSPASPMANRGWDRLVAAELAALGISLP